MNYTYDEAGNKLTQTDAEGRTTSWAYDALGRPISRTLLMGQTETYGYDGNSMPKATAPKAKSSMPMALEPA